MSEAINNVKQAFDAELAQTDLTNQEAVNNLRVKYLGKKGAVTDLMKQMGTLSAEERPAYGAPEEAGKRLCRYDAPGRRDSRRQHASALRRA